MRYADDLLVMCKTKQEAENALAALTAILAELGLELKHGQDADRAPARREARGWTSSASITATCAATPRGLRHLTFLVRWPSRQAMQHARQRVREITARERLLLPVEDIVEDLNRFLRRLGGLLPLRKLRPVLRQDHRSTPSTGCRSSSPTATSVTGGSGGGPSPARSPDRLGLIDLNGTIVPPRPIRSRHRAR